METQFNSMQAVKRRFFAMRNGVIAETLRRAGSPFHIIFGLNLPQISEIAAEWAGNPKAFELAGKLWANNTCRESMLLAPMLLHAAGGVDKVTAARMVSECPAAEITDILCHRLLRHAPYAAELAAELALENEAHLRYAALRLMFNIVNAHPDQAKKMALAEQERHCDYTRHIAASLLEEARFILGED